MLCGAAASASGEPFVGKYPEGVLFVIKGYWYRYQAPLLLLGVWRSGKCEELCGSLNRAAAILKGLALLWDDNFGNTVLVTACCFRGALHWSRFSWKAHPVPSWNSGMVIGVRVCSGEPYRSLHLECKSDLILQADSKSFPDPMATWAMFSRAHEFWFQSRIRVWGSHPALFTVRNQEWPVIPVVQGTQSHARVLSIRLCLQIRVRLQLARTVAIHIDASCHAKVSV